MNNLEKLKNAGIYKENNAFLYGTSLPDLWQYAAYGSTLATLVGMTNFVILRNEHGIVILPCDKIKNEIMLDKKIFIPINEIKYFNVENGNVGFYKISIMGQEKCLFSFQISKNVTPPLRENLDLLFNGIDCKNNEIIKEPNKTFVGIGIFMLLAIMAITLIFSIADGDYFIALCCIIFFIWFIKNKR